MSDERTHADIHSRSYKHLDDARHVASTSEKPYNSAETRAKMTDLFKARSEGKIPYDWQLDVAEAILLGLDSVVIAGTVERAEGAFKGPEQVVSSDNTRESSKECNSDGSIYDIRVYLWKVT